MMDVAILGAGELGGSLAYALARRELAHTIRLIDSNGRVAAGKALDIMQASPIEGFSATVTGTTEIAAAAGGTVIVVADRAGGEWTEEDGFLVLKQLSQIAVQRTIVCAGAAATRLIERGVQELRYSRLRLFGSAPEALAASLRALVALETNGSVRDVTLAVLGVPPAQIVVPWDAASVAGEALATLLDEPSRRRIANRVARLWPPGPYALANASAQAIAGISGQSRRQVSCFVAPDHSSGTRARTVALPVHLGADGIEKIVIPELSGSARVALDNAMLL
jgi:malate dehydrogenase